ncbi:unnamed protein product [Amoebophrya sp. A120]|nr:unnamed protein product [Amoebophrya sp. A120]|eukprot:GSA120T00009163001.1
MPAIVQHEDELQRDGASNNNFYPAPASKYSSSSSTPAGKNRPRQNYINLGKTRSISHTASPTSGASSAVPSAPGSYVTRQISGGRTMNKTTAAPVANYGYKKSAGTEQQQQQYSQKIDVYPLPQQEHQRLFEEYPTSFPKIPAGEPNWKGPSSKGAVFPAGRDVVHQYYVNHNQCSSSGTGFNSTSNHFYNKGASGGRRGGGGAPAADVASSYGYHSTSTEHTTAGDNFYPNAASGVVGKNKGCVIKGSSLPSTPHEQQLVRGKSGTSCSSPYQNQNMLPSLSCTAERGANTPTPTHAYGMKSKAANKGGGRRGGSGGSSQHHHAGHYHQHHGGNSCSPGTTIPTTPGSGQHRMNSKGNNKNNFEHHDYYNKRSPTIPPHLRSARQKSREFHLENNSTGSITTSHRNWSHDHPRVQQEQTDYEYHSQEHFPVTNISRQWSNEQQHLHVEKKQPTSGFYPSDLHQHERTRNQAQANDQHSTYAAGATLCSTTQQQGGMSNMSMSPYTNTTSQATSHVLHDGTSSNYDCNGAQFISRAGVQPMQENFYHNQYHETTTNNALGGGPGSCGPTAAGYNKNTATAMIVPAQDEQQHQQQQQGLMSVEDYVGGKGGPTARGGGGSIAPPAGQQLYYHAATTPGATAVTSAKSGRHDCSTAPGSHRNDVNPCSSYGTTTPGYDHSTSKDCQPVFATVPAQNVIPGEGGCATTTQHHYEPDRPHHNVVRLAHHPELAAMETSSLPPESCAAEEGTKVDGTTTARAGEACKQKQMNRKDDANNIQTALVTRNDRLLHARDVVRKVEEQAAALTKKKPDDEQREDNAGPLKLRTDEARSGPAAQRQRSGEKGKSRRMGSSPHQDPTAAGNAPAQQQAPEFFFPFGTTPQQQHAQFLGGQPQVPPLFGQATSPDIEQAVRLGFSTPSPRTDSAALLVPENTNTASSLQVSMPKISQFSIGPGGPPAQTTSSSPSSNKLETGELVQQATSTTAGPAAHTTSLALDGDTTSATNKFSRTGVGPLALSQEQDEDEASSAKNMKLRSGSTASSTVFDSTTQQYYPRFSVIEIPLVEKQRALSRNFFRSQLENPVTAVNNNIDDAAEQRRAGGDRDPPPEDQDQIQNNGAVVPRSLRQNFGFMRNFPLLRHLERPQLEKAAKSMAGRMYGKGLTVYRQGEPGDRMFLILSGLAHVVVRDEKLLHVGDTVQIRKAVHFSGKRFLPGTLARIDKYDGAREFPFTITVLEDQDLTGKVEVMHDSQNTTQDSSSQQPPRKQRGRVWGNEIEPAHDPVVERYITTLVPGDYFGEQQMFGTKERGETVVVGKKADLAVMTMSKNTYRSLGLPYKLPLGPRRAVYLQNSAQRTITGLSTPRGVGAAVTLDEQQAASSSSATTSFTPKNKNDAGTTSTTGPALSAPQTPAGQGTSESITPRTAIFTEKDETAPLKYAPISRFLNIHEKTVEEKRKLIKMLRKSQALRQLLADVLTEERLEQLADVAFLQKFTKNEVIVKANDLEHDKMLLVKSGEFLVFTPKELLVDGGGVVSPREQDAEDYTEVVAAPGEQELEYYNTAVSSSSAVMSRTKNEDRKPRKSTAKFFPNPRFSQGMLSLAECEQQSRHLKENQEGGIFGEYTVLYGIPPAFSVKCETDEGFCWVIPQLAFKTILLSSQKTNMRKILETLTDIRELSVLNHHEKLELAATSKIIHLEKDQSIKFGQNFEVQMNQASQQAVSGEMGLGQQEEHAQAARQAGPSSTQISPSGVVSTTGGVRGFGLSPGEVSTDRNMMYTGAYYNSHGTPAPMQNLTTMSTSNNNFFAGAGRGGQHQNRQNNRSGPAAADGGGATGSSSSPSKLKTDPLYHAADNFFRSYQAHVTANGHSARNRKEEMNLDFIHSIQQDNSLYLLLNGEVEIRGPNLNPEKTVEGSGSRSNHPPQHNEVKNNPHIGISYQEAERIGYTMSDPVVVLRGNSSRLVSMFQYEDHEVDDPYEAKDWDEMRREFIKGRIKRRKSTSFGANNRLTTQKAGRAGATSRTSKNSAEIAEGTTVDATTTRYDTAYEGRDTHTTVPLSKEDESPIGEDYDFVEDSTNLAAPPEPENAEELEVVEPLPRQQEVNENNEDNNPAVRIEQLQHLQYFGERTLLRPMDISAGSRSKALPQGSRASSSSRSRAGTMGGGPMYAKATVTSLQGATILVVPPSTFYRVFPPSLGESMLQAGVERRSEPQENTEEHDILQDVDLFLNWRPIPLNSLKELNVLGCGGFGRVSLRVHVESGSTFALKSISKGFLQRKRMESAVFREKEILFLCKCRFIVRTFQTYRDNAYVHFLMEVCLGGELFYQYHRFKYHGSITKAKFYSATVITAFAYLHARGVLYRDLKPENLLLDHRGCCKLTDMGLAKIIGTNGNVKTYTTCGTPDYFAPEIVKHEGQTLAVDWWCLGVLVFELMTGNAPFEASDTQRTMQRIVRGVSRVNFDGFQRRAPDPDCVDLVVGLLQGDAARRLPMRKGGPLKNLREHPWYKHFPWREMWQGTVEAPFIPRVQTNQDCGNFRPKNKPPPAQDYNPHAPGHDPDWDRDF